jgi:hypothetical protein
VVLYVLARITCTLGVLVGGLAALSPKADVVSESTGVTLGLIGLACGVAGGVFAWMDSKYVRRELFESELRGVRQSMRDEFANTRATLKRIDNHLLSSVKGPGR